MTVNKLGHADLEGMTADGGTVLRPQQVTIERMASGEFAITILGRKDSIVLSFSSCETIKSSLAYEWNLDEQVKDARFEISPVGDGMFCVLDQMIPNRAYFGDYESCEHFIHEQSKCLLDHTA